MGKNPEKFLKIHMSLLIKSAILLLMLKKRFFILIIVILLSINYSYSESTETVLNFQTPYTVVAKADFPINKILFSPNGKKFICSWGKSIVLFDAVTYEQIYTFPEQEAPVSTLIFNPDSKHFLTLLTNNTIIIKNSEDYSEVNRISNIYNYENNTILTAAFTPDTFSIIAPLNGNDISLCFRLIMTKNYITTKLGEHSNQVYSLDVSKDNKLLSTALDGNIQLFDLNTNKQITTYSTYIGTIIPAVFHPDGNSFISSKSENVLVIRNLQGEEILSIFDDDIPINSIVFSPDGKYFAVPVQNGKVKIYDYKTGRLVNSLRFSAYSNKADDMICDIAFSPDGKYLLTSSEQGYILKWAIAEQTVSKTEVKTEVIEIIKPVIQPETVETANEAVVQSEPTKIEKNTVLPEESNETAQTVIDEEIRIPTASLYFGLGYSTVPSSYYAGSFYLDMFFQKNIDNTPITVGLDFIVGIAFPNKNYPYNYTFFDGSTSKNPRIVTIKPSLSIGYELFSKNKNRLFFSVNPGMAIRFLWNGSASKCIKTDSYKSFAIDASGGIDIKGFTIKANIAFDTQFGIQPSLNLGYTVKFY